MIRDEMKNRISRVLVNPVLKQGFEAMYKEYIELKGESDKLLKNRCKGEEPCLFLKKRDGQLHKAKELIEKMLNAFASNDFFDEEELSAMSEAEQFLKECGE